MAANVEEGIKEVAAQLAEDKYDLDTVFPKSTLVYTDSRVSKGRSSSAFNVLTMRV